MIPEVDQELRNWGDCFRGRLPARMGYVQTRYDGLHVAGRQCGRSVNVADAERVEGLLVAFKRRWPDHYRALWCKYVFGLTDKEGARNCRCSTAQYKQLVDRAHFWLESHLRNVA